MNYSKLTDIVCLSPNKSARKNLFYNPSGKVVGIVIHHAAAKATAEALGSLFADPNRQASANYGIGFDGTIVCMVPEDYRAWTTGDKGVDYKCITIEVANCSGEPDWKISDQAMESLIALCADIAKRHGIRMNYTGGKDGNMHMHKWYQATACPGPYLAGKFPEIAREVNRRLDGEKNVFYRVQVGAFNDPKNATALRDKLHSEGYKDAFIVEVERT